MAAILCKSMGDLCSGCGELICLPCKACGMGCSTLCSGCSALCSGISGPFLPYLVVTFALNLPPAVLAAKSAMNVVNCHEESTWMIVSGALSVVHMFAALYIVGKIRNDEIPQQHQQMQTAQVVAAEPINSKNNGKTGKMDKMERGQPATKPGAVSVQPGAVNVQEVRTGKVESGFVMLENDGPPPMTMGKIKQVLCYDGGVAIYIVLAIFWVIWQSMGISKYFTHDSQNCGDVGGSMLTTLFCGWIYMCLVGIAFMCSMCCLRL